MKAKQYILLLFLFLITSCSKSQNMINSETVKELDLNRYLGTWYELARYPHSFEKDLVGVTATYSLRPDGKIKVVNKGFKKTLNGEMSQAIGKAKIPNLKEPAKLKVSFFLFFYADYYVLELDSEYQWAIIGSKSPNYLWILSRKPQISDELYESLLEKIKSRGYKLDKLIKVEQKK